MTTPNSFYGFSKRVMDIAGSLVGLLLFAPVILGAALYIFLRMEGTILFRQQRTGKNGEIFTILKFRTMRDAAGLSDAARLTPAGTLLRALSVDELPQLWNVLRGDMSLVGPRPLLPEYLPHYSDQQLRRHDVKPGITGWAQVHGRNELSWDRKFQLDVWYVDNASPSVDLTILAKTVGKVLKRSGVSAVGQATVTRFYQTA